MEFGICGCFRTKDDLRVCFSLISVYILFTRSLMSFEEHRSKRFRSMSMSVSFPIFIQCSSALLEGAKSPFGASMVKEMKKACISFAKHRLSMSFSKQ